MGNFWERGVIIQEEIDTLHSYGVERIYSPEDGRKLGLVGMITDLLQKSDQNLLQTVPQTLTKHSDPAIARAISFAEENASKIQHLLKPTENPAPTSMAPDGSKMIRQPHSFSARSCQSDRVEHLNHEKRSKSLKNTV